MRRRLSRSRWVALYYVSWIVFGAVGILLNMVCAVLLALPGRESFGRPTRLVIRRLFQSWLAWLHATRVVAVNWLGFDGPALRPGTVYIANHPSIADATFILARLPDAVCIFKPALMRNPAIGPAAVMAGYVRGDSGLDLIKAAAARVASGQSLLVFPEGTRTPEGTLVGKMKPGFALIADRARAPVQLMIITASPGIGAKGRPWWPAPEALPASFAITLDRLWDYEPGRSAAELTREVELRVHQVLAGGRNR
jgi:1-acyl-sn-glycerol-3-phosphate acyltransferase